MGPARQPSHLRSGLEVSAVAAMWTLVASAAGIWIGVAQHSVALLAFGVVGLLDAAGSVTLVAHFALAGVGHHRAEQVERIALRLITGGLLAVGVATGALSVLQLVDGRGGDASWAALALTAASLATLTVLAWRKRWVARRLVSHALLADSHLSAVGALLAAVTLAGVVATRALGWWWADATAAMAIGMAAVAVALSLLREPEPEQRALVAPADRP